MNPPAFDLRLWLICTALASGVFAVPTATTFINGHASVATLAVSFVVSLFLGFLLQGCVLGIGFRWTRDRPDQAEDYDDRG
jgi:hypothetical protein